MSQFVVFLALAFGIQAVAACSAGYTTSPDGNCYLIGVNRVLNRAEAEAFCQMYGNGQLLSIESERELKYIIKIVEKNNSDFDGFITNAKLGDNGLWSWGVDSFKLKQEPDLFPGHSAIEESELFTISLMQKSDDIQKTQLYEVDISASDLEMATICET